MLNFKRMKMAIKNSPCIRFVFSRRWWKEPALNLIAAAAQMSSYTHVELAIGELPGDGGQMANVARVYNDNVGVVSLFAQTEPPCAHSHTS